MIEPSTTFLGIDSEFQLDLDFVNSYRTAKPPFGFNGLGEVVYMRTYSRNIGESDTKEQWFQTVQRVCFCCDAIVLITAGCERHFYDAERDVYPK